MITLGQKEDEVLVCCIITAESEKYAIKRFLKIWPFTRRIVSVIETEEWFSPAKEKSQEVINGIQINWISIDDLIDEFNESLFIRCSFKVTS